MDVFGFDFEIVGSLLGEAARSSLGEKMIVVAAVWMIMEKKVSKHFQHIEASLGAIATSVDGLKESMIDLETQQSKKINDLSERVTRLENKE